MSEPAFLRKYLAGVRRGIQHVTSRDRLDIVPQMTLLLLLLFNLNYYGEFSLFLLILATLPVIFPVLFRSEIFWFIAGIGQTVHILSSYFLVDDHKYLLAYWCLVLWLTFKAPAAKRIAILSFNARVLTGLVMLFAVAWKSLISSHYVSGTFFYFRLMTDFRFAPLLAMLGFQPGLRPEENHIALDLLTQSVHTGVPFTEIALYPSDQVLWLAHFFTWSTVLLEGALAFTFLTNLGPPRLKHYLLQIFILVTYAVVPVIGFGWLFIAMGIAQCPPEWRHIRLIYVVLFVLLLWRVYLW